MRTREIKSNALYDLDGVVCRVKKQLKNGKFLVTHHKTFHTIVGGPQLKKIGFGRVRSYLRQAGVNA